MNIVLTTSNYYVPYTYVCMQSILESTFGDIVFYILSNDISEESKEKIENLRKIRDFDIKYVPVNTSTYPIPKQARAASIVYAKMYLPDLIPDVDKCIVLDSDIIVKCDLSEIYNIDLKGKYVAWVPDQIDTRIKKERYWFDAFNMPKEKLYINSGVLILNLSLYKKDQISSKINQVYKTYKDDIRFFDQDILYILLSDKCIYLDYKYNYLSQLPYTDPKVKKKLKKECQIIHYGAEYKPWLYLDEEKAEIWWSYARKTPFYEEILSRMIDFKISQRPQFDYHTMYMLAHPIYFKLKKLRYRLLKHITFGHKRQHYRKKYQTLKDQLK
ncbi:MAG: glycosyltransferase family 8 protein [Alphaproteobacteria bacterium]|nr:glycosyltransferase family 8 protein [Alphaproteobacteria bacterium]